MPSGGGGGGDSVDREYNARMATIAEKQQAMAEEYFQYWKSGPGHWKTRPADYAGSSSSGIRSVFDSLVPKTEKVWVKDEGGVSYMDMEQAQMKSNMELIPKQTKYMSTSLDAETGLVPQRASLESALIAEQQENIALRKPVTSKFYDEVLKGVDVDERVNLARADVESAYAGAESNARRWASGMGINPASKSYSAGLMSLAKEKAAAKVGATSLARRQAEEENFARLSSAVGLGSA